MLRIKGIKFRILLRQHIGRAKGTDSGRLRRKEMLVCETDVAKILKGDGYRRGFISIVVIINKFCLVYHV